LARVYRENCTFKYKVKIGLTEGWLSSKTQITANVGEDVTKQESIYTVGRNIN
jgi:hypothetical protein